ncbi:hypothetical protein HOY34_17255 [Xinfangfangia sp. D13-10-4-6]|uniref:hypothetical protein n=1 Tax=Pseudogemmobacter hezensis TaxID=2737662 RepID=UPI00155227A6|nr:hypothetical protein [Pseudogemmobacter hezensis]NPD16943.1 hypothetical protein [Pseudogemmobacter hezensis]
MRRDMGLMVQLARQAADPAFGYHLLLLRDAGYLDQHNQMTEAGKAFVAGAEAADMKKPLTVEGLLEALSDANKRGIFLNFAL